MEAATTPRRRHRHRGNSGWRCPRCKEVGSPHRCTCMKQLRQRLDEVRRHLRRGAPGMAEVELAQASELLRLLQLDGEKVSRG